MTLASGNISCMRIWRGFLLAGTSNESGVVDDCNFGDLSGYFFGSFRDKASNIIWRYATPCRLWLIAKRTTLSGYFKSKLLCQHC